DGVNVLIDGVGCALIPLLTDPLHRRQHLDELSHLASHDVPTFADVPVQGQGLVLSEDVNPPQVGVDAVRKRDVDDAVNTTKRDRRLGTVTGEGIESLACPSG